MDRDCIFCKIINQETPAKIIAQNDDVIVIEDITPKSQIHYLLIPKKHIKDIQSLQKNETQVGAAIFDMAQHISSNLHNGQAFRLLMNNGAGVGQSVFHLHCHYLAGKKMFDF